jgi:hypothetical protein
LSKLSHGGLEREETRERGIRGRGRRREETVGEDSEQKGFQAGGAEEESSVHGEADAGCAVLDKDHGQEEDSHGADAERSRQHRIPTVKKKRSKDSRHILGKRHGEHTRNDSVQECRQGIHPGQAAPSIHGSLFKVVFSSENSRPPASHPMHERRAFGGAWKYQALALGFTG